MLDLLKGLDHIIVMTLRIDPVREGNSAKVVTIGAFSLK